MPTVGGLQRNYGKLPNSNIRNRGTNQGITSSSSVKLPGANYTSLTGSDSRGRLYNRTTSRFGGLGSQSGSYRETKSQTPINNPTRVKQKIDPKTDNSVDQVRGRSTRTRNSISGKPSFALKKRKIQAPGLVRRVARNALKKLLNI